ncbi:MAG: ABC transporter ATP-binding protein, partial [Pseudomonadota bacterium]
TALIFQNLALFPLMSVWENVAFGLEARGVSRRERKARAEELLNLVALSDQAGKKPTELSGGQKQRVAIARALAVDPAVLLLDEPLSALDLKLRQHMRAELRDIQQKTGVTFIYITHDQGEALTMSDRIAVMNEGRIEQIGSADDIYSHPETAFSASFVGETNQFQGRVAMLDGDMAHVETPVGRIVGRNPKRLKNGDEAILFVRPEAMQISAGSNQLPVTLERRDLEGAFINMFLRTETGGELSMSLPNAGAAGNTTKIERIGFDRDSAVVLPDGPLAKTGREELAAQ